MAHIDTVSCAKTLITENKIITDGCLVMGAPGRVMRSAAA